MVPPRRSCVKQFNRSRSCVEWFNGGRFKSFEAERGGREAQISEEEKVLWVHAAESFATRMQVIFFNRHKLERESALSDFPSYWSHISSCSSTYTESCHSLDVFVDLKNLQPPSKQDIAPFMEISWIFSSFFQMFEKSANHFLELPLPLC